MEAAKCPGSSEAEGEEQRPYQVPMDTGSLKDKHVESVEEAEGRSGIYIDDPEVGIEERMVVVNRIFLAMGISVLNDSASENKNECAERSLACAMVIGCVTLS